MPGFASTKVRFQMKAASSALTATLILLTCAGTTHAQHYSLKHFDDLTFAAMSETRMLRWEIHDNFAESRDLPRLLRDVENVMDHLHTLQRSIYLERAPRVLDRELDAVLEDLKLLRKDLMNSDYAKHTGPTYHHHSNGYVFIPETMHAGRRHVDHALQHVAKIERSLNEFHHELMAYLEPRGRREIESTPIVPPGPSRPMPLMLPPSSSHTPSSSKGDKKKVSAVNSVNASETIASARSRRIKHMPNPAGTTSPPRPFTETGLKWA